MRTTVEITADQRARLLELAARRGEKGFSRLVQEALDEFLESRSEEEDSRRRALSLRGVLLTRNLRHFERVPGLSLGSLPG
jgi:predicted nucleic acid-binding protein